MSLPNVNINITNGNLGLIGAGADGLCGIICSGTAVANMPLLSPKLIHGLEGLKNLGVTQSNNPSLYRHVEEFYSEGRDGLDLWIMTIVNTESLENICSPENNFAKKILDAANGKIRFLGVTRSPNSGYSPSISMGLDEDCYTAITTAQELAVAYSNDNAPLRVLIEAREFTGEEADLQDLHERTSNRVAMVLMSSTNDGNSSVGLVLGRKAGNPVQRKISRVKDGALPLNNCYAGAKDIATYTGVATIHDKGFITARTFRGKSGFYITDDPTCTSLTDDYSSLSNGFVIDKAHRIAYEVYVNELNDEVEVNEAGQMNAGTLKSLEAKIDTQIDLQMAGEISAGKATINPNQNVISTGSTTISLNITPVGYYKNIIVNIGFKNPALTNS